MNCVRTSAPWHKACHYHILPLQEVRTSIGADKLTFSLCIRRHSPDNSRLLMRPKESMKKGHPPASFLMDSLSSIPGWSHQYPPFPTANKKPREVRGYSFKTKVCLILVHGLGQVLFHIGHLLSGLLLLLSALLLLLRNRSPFIELTAHF